jgi:hypothetical protein
LTAGRAGEGRKAGGLWLEKIDQLGSPGKKKWVIHGQRDAMAWRKKKITGRSRLSKAAAFMMFS